MKVSIVGHLVGRPRIEGQVGEQQAIRPGDYTVSESDIRGVYALTGRGREYVVTENEFKSARALGRVQTTAARESAPPAKNKLDEAVDQLLAGEGFESIVRKTHGE